MLQTHPSMLQIVIMTKAFCYRSKMSSLEQTRIVEEISSVVSHQMGLREQLEVIRIINPQALVSPTDAEFVIGKYSITCVE